MSNSLAFLLSLLCLLTVLDCASAAEAPVYSAQYFFGQKHTKDDYDEFHLTERALYVWCDASKEAQDASTGGEADVPFFFSCFPIDQNSHKLTHQVAYDFNILLPELQLTKVVNIFSRPGYDLLVAVDHHNSRVVSLRLTHPFSRNFRVKILAHYHPGHCCLAYLNEASDQVYIFQWMDTKGIKSPIYLNESKLYSRKFDSFFCKDLKVYENEQGLVLLMSTYRNVWPDVYLLPLPFENSPLLEVTLQHQKYFFENFLVVEKYPTANKYELKVHKGFDRPYNPENVSIYPDGDYFIWGVGLEGYIVHVLITENKKEPYELVEIGSFYPDRFIHGSKRNLLLRSQRSCFHFISFPSG
jgi:hypothetical protein